MIDFKGKNKDKSSSENSESIQFAFLKDIAEYKIIESDHSITNKWKELSDYIIAWLEKTKHNKN